MGVYVSVRYVEYFVNYVCINAWEHCVNQWLCLCIVLLIYKPEIRNNFPSQLVIIYIICARCSLYCEYKTRHVNDVSMAHLASIPSIRSVCQQQGADKCLIMTTLSLLNVDVTMRLHQCHIQNIGRQSIPAPV